MLTSRSTGLAEARRWTYRSLVTGIPKGSGRIAGGFNHREHRAPTMSPERTMLRGSNRGPRFPSRPASRRSTSGKSWFVPVFHPSNAIIQRRVRSDSSTSWDGIWRTIFLVVRGTTSSLQDLENGGSCPVVETTGYTTFPLRGIAYR
jgi:hypothetical protein